MNEFVFRAEGGKLFSFLILCMGSKNNHLALLLHSVCKLLTLGNINLY